MVLDKDFVKPMQVDKILSEIYVSKYAISLEINSALKKISNWTKGKLRKKEEKKIIENNEKERLIDLTKLKTKSALKLWITFYER